MPDRRAAQPLYPSLPAPHKRCRLLGFGTDHGNLEVRVVTQQLLRQSAAEHPHQWSLARTADDDRRRVLFAGIAKNLRVDLSAAQGCGFAAQAFGELEGAVEGGLRRRIAHPSGVDEDHCPWCTPALGEPLAGAHDLFRIEPSIDGDNHAVARGPRALFALALHRPVSYTHLRAHETDSYLVCRL